MYFIITAEDQSDAVKARSAHTALSFSEKYQPRISEPRLENCTERLSTTISDRRDSQQ